MDKVRKWSGMTLFEKAVTITLWAILLVYGLVMVLWCCDVLESGVEISKLLMGTAWALLGLVWWKKNRKLAIAYFILSGLSFALALVRIFLP